jgi:hypothetical protein
MAVMNRTFESVIQIADMYGILSRRVLTTPHKLRPEARLHKPARAEQGVAAMRKPTAEDGSFMR